MNLKSYRLLGVSEEGEGWDHKLWITIVDGNDVGVQISITNEVAERLFSILKSASLHNKLGSLEKVRSKLDEHEAEEVEKEIEDLHELIMEG